MRRARTLLALAALLALGVTGCTVRPDPPAAAARTPDPTARTGGTLRVGITEPASIDPSLATTRDPSGLLVVSVLCDPPISFDPVTGEPRPAAAARYQSVDGGSSATVTLRGDVLLHDGSGAGAEDVTFALARAVRPETVSPSAELLEELRGYSQLREGEAEGDTLTGARVIGPRDLELLVPFRRGDLIRVLGHPIAAPLPRGVLREMDAAGEADDFSARPVCDGPYRLTDAWEPGDAEIRLTRFEDHFGRNAAYTRGGSGYPDEILFRIYPDDAAVLEGFRAGDVDVAHVPEVALPQASELGTVERVPTLRLDMIGLPTSTPPFDDPAVRRAVGRALDREALIDRVYGGARVPATGVFSPALGEGLYREDACGADAPASGDVAGAQELLRAEGVTLEGETVPLYFNDELGHRALVEEVARQWSEAFGLTAEPRPMGWEAFLQRGEEATGFDGPFRWSWAPPYPSAHLYLEPLFSSANIGSTNLSRFSDQRFDDLLTRDARRAVTAEEQAQVYAELEDMICARMPVVPVSFATAHYVFRTGTVSSAVDRATHRTWALPLLRELYLVGP